MVSEEGYVSKSPKTHQCGEAALPEIARILIQFPKRSFPFFCHPTKSRAPPSTESTSVVASSPPHQLVHCSATNTGSTQQGKGRRGQESHRTAADRALTRASTRVVTGPRCLPWPAISALAPSQGQSQSPVQNPGFLGKQKRNPWRWSTPGTMQ